jgi:hypothetical protein
LESLATLAGGVAQEINSVLGVLVGHTELMLMKMPDSHPLKKNLHTIMKSSKTRAIIQDMLILAGRGVTVSSPLSLTPSSKTSSRLGIPAAKEGRPRFVLTVSPRGKSAHHPGIAGVSGKSVHHLIANAWTISPNTAKSPSARQQLPGQTPARLHRHP